MKELLYWHQEVSFNGGKTWESITIREYLDYITPNTEEIAFNTFEELKNAVTVGYIMKATCGENWVKISTIARDFSKKIHKAKYKAILVRNAHRNPEDITFQDIMNKLPYESFIEFCHDHLRG